MTRFNTHGLRLYIGFAFSAAIDIAKEFVVFALHFIFLYNTYTCSSFLLSQPYTVFWREVSYYTMTVKSPV